MIFTTTSAFIFIGIGRSAGVNTPGAPMAAITIARIVVIPTVKSHNDSPVFQRCQLEANYERP